MHPLIRALQKSQLKDVPEIKTGNTVRVSQKVREGGKERIQSFEGLVIKVGHGEGVEKTFTVRKIVEGIGVEKVFPAHSPDITKIIVKKVAKIRRSKLYNMRERFGKSARLSEHLVSDEERAKTEAKMEEYIDEAIKAEEERKKAEAQKQAGNTEDKTESPAA
jgi:large subunit ribosomal protein L19